MLQRPWVTNVHNRFFSYVRRMTARQTFLKRPDRVTTSATARERVLFTYSHENMDENLRQCVLSQGHADILIYLAISKNVS